MSAMNPPTDPKPSQQVTTNDGDYPPRIRTVGKMPPPQGLSYPLPESLVSEAFVGVPMFDRLTLSYSNHTPLRQMQYPLKEFPMVRITFKRYPVYENGDGRQQGGDRWTIEILPTPAQHREFIQKVIVMKGLPLLREWLLEISKSCDLEGSAVKECWYEIQTATVVLR